MHICFSRSLALAAGASSPFVVSLAAMDMQPPVNTGNSAVEAMPSGSACMRCQSVSLLELQPHRVRNTQHSPGERCSFENQPDKEIRDQVRSLGLRWNEFRKEWHGTCTFVELGGVLEGVFDDVSIKPIKLWLELKVVDGVLLRSSCFNSRIDEFWWIWEFNC